MASTFDDSIPSINRIYPRESLFNYKNIYNTSNNNKIVVISIIGNSYFGCGSILHSITGVSCFYDQFEKIHQFDETNDVSLYYYYDNSKNIVYLHLSSFLDKKAIDHHIDNLYNKENTDDFIKWLDESEFECIKALLYIFLISHYIFDVNPGHVIRLNDFKLFRILQKSKKLIIHDIYKYLGNVNDKLEYLLPRNVNISNIDKRFYPGYCIPYIFFIFHAPKYLPPSIKNKNTKNYQEEQTIEETLKFNLEIQLKELLRINRLDRGSISGALTRERETILFTLDPKVICYVVSQRSQNKENSIGILSSMIHSQLPESIFKDKNEYNNIYHPSYGPAEVLSIFTKEQTISSGISSLSTFTFRLAQQSLKSRSLPLPCISLWYIWSLSLGDFFLFGNKKDINDISDPRGNTDKLRKLINPNKVFSLSRCGMILSKVRETYYLDIPEVYTKLEHEARLVKSLQLYYTHARGSSLNSFKEQIIEEFTNYWSFGRQRCEQRSFTGHFCKYPIHNTPDKEIIETDNDNDNTQQLNTRNHCSEFITTGACNCGKTRKTRKDPFSLKEANCDFFKARCCNSMMSIELPNTEECKNWNIVVIGKSLMYEPKVGMAQDGFKMRYKYLVPYELGSTPKPTNKVNNHHRQEEDFPSLQTSRSNIKRKSDKMPRKRNITTNKINSGGWIGYEYECPMGHRFIEPIHSILHYAGISNVDQNILTIEQAFTTEIPLYISCKSNDNQHNLSSLAKLQRIYLTTPINISLKINPRVQIIGNIAGTRRQLISNLGKQILLPTDSFICIRLPYIYTYENNPLDYQQSISSPYKCGFKLIYQRKFGTILCRYRSLLQYSNGRNSFWISIDGRVIIARANSLEQISKDWKECQHIYMKESKKIGITQFSFLHLLHLYENHMNKAKVTNIPDNRNELDESLKEEVYMIICDIIENNNSEFNLGKLIRQNKWIFEYKGENDKTILHRAVCVGSIEIVELIFQKAAGERFDINIKDKNGYTALHYACCLGLFRICEILLQNYAFIVNTDNTGSTPLHHFVKCDLPNNATIFQFRRIFLQITDNGYPINIPDKNGNTILHNAVYAGNVGAVTCILDENPLFLRNNYGDTPIRIAKEQNNNEIYNLLISKRASSRIYQSTLPVISKVGKSEPNLTCTPNISPPNGKWETVSPSKLKKYKKSVFSCEYDSLVHRFCLLQLFHESTCEQCSGKLTTNSNCFACSVCNRIVHSTGDCKQNFLLNNPCIPPTPERLRKPIRTNSVKFDTLEKFPSEMLTIFTISELQSLYNAFELADVNSCGFIVLEDFCTILGPILDSPGIREYVFNLFDIERNGSIEFPEFIRGFAVMKYGTPKEKLKLAFSALCNPEKESIELCDVTDIFLNLFPLLRNTTHLCYTTFDEFQNLFFSRLSVDDDKKYITCANYLDRALDNLSFIGSAGYITEHSPDLHRQSMDIFQAGSSITFENINWVTTQYIMIGMRLAITEASIHDNIVSSSEDISENVTFCLTDNTENIKKSWKFIDSARNLFGKIRKMINITTTSYQLSWGPERMIGNLFLGNFSSVLQVNSTGRSGSLFFKSADKKYILKTVPTTEILTLKKILTKYVKHLELYSDSLLPRFLGIHAIECQEDNIFLEFVIMENIFYSIYDINEQYDLKGSTVDRHVEVDTITSDVARKDLDFTRTLNLSNDAKIKLLEQIEIDCRFLELHNLCDYSLLVGIHFFDKGSPIPLLQNQTQDSRFFNKDYGGIMSVDGTEIYYISIIDTLTTYGITKRSERAIKSVINFNDKGISAMPPIPYRQRFQKYISSILE